MKVDGQTSLPIWSKCISLVKRGRSPVRPEKAGHGRQAPAEQAPAEGGPGPGAGGRMRGRPGAEKGSNAGGGQTPIYWSNAGGGLVVYPGVRLEEAVDVGVEEPRRQLRTREIT